MNDSSQIAVNFKPFSYLNSLSINAHRGSLFFFSSSLALGSGVCTLCYECCEFVARDDGLTSGGSSGSGYIVMLGSGARSTHLFPRVIFCRDFPNSFGFTVNYAVAYDFS